MSDDASAAKGYTGLNAGFAAVIASLVAVHACMATTRVAATLWVLHQGYGGGFVGVLLSLFAVAPLGLSLWAGRLAGRYPVAAMLLLRVRIRTLVQLGADQEAAALTAEAAALAEQVGSPPGAPGHEAFVAELEAGKRKARWRRW